jgi:hypothetical protein
LLRKDLRLSSGYYRMDAENELEIPFAGDMYRYRRKFVWN